MYDNDWIEDGLNTIETKILQEKDAKKRRKEQHKEHMLQQGFSLCFRCHGSGRISKNEGRTLYPRENIKDKINTKCPVCRGKKFIKDQKSPVPNG